MDLGQLLLLPWLDLTLFDRPRRGQGPQRAADAAAAIFRAMFELRPTDEGGFVLYQRRFLGGRVLRRDTRPLLGVVPADLLATDRAEELLVWALRRRDGQRGSTPAPLAVSPMPSEDEVTRVPPEAVRIRVARLSDGAVTRARRRRAVCSAGACQEAPTCWASYVVLTETGGEIRTYRALCERHAAMLRERAADQGP